MIILTFHQEAFEKCLTKQSYIWNNFCLWPFGRKATNKGEFSWEKTDKTDLFKL